MSGRIDLWVVVPAYNEERWIGATLEALLAQRTDEPFTVLVVDNASTDATFDVVEAWGHTHAALDLRLLSETVKGTGAASDSGFRHAIGQGARYVLRTDADSLPAPDWVARMRHALAEEQLDLVGGRVRPRFDDDTSRTGYVVISTLVAWAMRNLGRFNPVNRGPQYRCVYARSWF